MKKISWISFLLGFMLAIAFIVSIGIVQTNVKASKLSSYGSGTLGSPWDGYDKAFKLATIIDDVGYIFVFKDENTPSHFYFPFGERVYVHYLEDGFFFVERYYNCLEQPIYGWISVSHVLLDEKVTYK